MNNTCHQDPESDVLNKAAMESTSKISPKVNFNIQDNNHQQNMDRGDGKANWTANKRSMKNNNNNNNLSDCYAAGECYHKHHFNVAPQSNTHLQSHTAHQNNTRTLQFTPNMIKDQELLVNSMSQQGISEALIRRQFDRLLDEQIKQLKCQSDYKQIEQKHPEEASHERRNRPEEPSSCNDYRQRPVIDECKLPENGYPHQHQQYPKRCEITEENNANETNENDNSCPRPKVEASSLLKIRLQREALETQKRNNGLQESNFAVEILKKCKYGRTKNVDRMIEVSNDSLNNEKENDSYVPYVRLNGTQDKSLIENLPFTQRPTDKEANTKHCSFNGVENQRLPNNPPPTSRTRQMRTYENDEGYSYVYPQQKCPMASPQNGYSHYNSNYNSNNQNNNNYNNNENNNHDINNNNMSPDNPFYNHGYRSYQRTETPSNQEQISQSPHNTCNDNNPVAHHDNNNVNYSSDLQESRIFGGITYNVRKPQCMPNVLEYQHS